MHLISKVIPVEMINAIITGFTPLINLLKYWFLTKFLRSIAINKMIIKEGRTTPKVAHILPKKPLEGFI